MSEARSPEEGIATAIHDLSDQTTTLVRQEVQAVKEEMLEKAKQWSPALGFGGLATLSGIFATASLYRLVLKLIDGLLPRPVAAVAAPVFFGGLSFFAARQAIKQVKDAPPMPVPTEAARTAADKIASAVKEQQA